MLINISKICILIILMVTLNECTKTDTSEVALGLSEVLVNNGAVGKYAVKDIKGPSMSMYIYVEEEYNLEEIKNIMREIDSYLRLDDNFNYFFGEAVDEIHIRFERRFDYNSDYYFIFTTFELDGTYTIRYKLDGERIRDIFIIE